MLEEFREWQLATKDSIDKWTDKLIKEALKQGEVGKAEDWLRRNKPTPSGDFHATTSEQFNTIVQTMFEDAKRELHKEVRKLRFKQNGDEE
ncbi:MAG: hypothetical protein SPG45_06320 [Lactobacillus johnsonii]|nr:hypothetical protein [Lactobacillus johnsonii]MDY5351675.1 hypothetical protein [Lactobacillus johnsonii]MDY5419646.1 hypothetical protein [Lactobacillus johnsonii]